jgi:hypothetical protein
VGQGGAGQGAPSDGGCSQAGRGVGAWWGSALGLLALWRRARRPGKTART